MYYNCVLFSASDLKCETNSTSELFVIEGEYRKYSCEQKYAGNGALVMTWSIGGEKTTDVKNETKGNTVKFSIVIHIHSSAKASTITCETKYVPPKRDSFPKNAATNVPRYSRGYWIRAPTFCCKYLLFNFVLT